MNILIIETTVHGGYEEDVETETHLIAATDKTLLAVLRTTIADLKKLGVSEVVMDWVHNYGDRLEVLELPVMSAGSVVLIASEDAPCFFRFSKEKQMRQVTQEVEVPVIEAVDASRHKPIGKPKPDKQYKKK